VAGEGIERSWAGGRLGREVIDRFLQDVKLSLSPDGFGYILLLNDNCPDEVAGILEDGGFGVKKIIERKIRGEELLVLRFARGN